MSTMGGLGIAALFGILFLASSKKTTTAPRGTVTVGPIRIIKSPAPAKKAAAKPKPPPVRAATPTSVRDTAAVAVQAAAQPGKRPIPNPVAARKLAQPLADHVRNNRKKYDRERVATWQAFAGIASDGIYGPKTAAALRAYGAKSVVG
jgi:hypothetical protein